MTATAIAKSNEVTNTEVAAASKKLRFTVGEVYWFARALFTQKPGAERQFTSLFVPWAHDLNKIEFLPLLCKEHHKVAWEQDPNNEKKYDGFVFVSPTDDKDIWYNQYPTACYGQLDDTNDRVVFKHYEISELCVMDDNGQPRKDDNGQLSRLPGSEEKWAYNYSTFWESRFTLATSMLDVIERGITRNNDIFTVEQCKMLKEYRDQFIQELEEASGKIVIWREWSLPPKDGGPREYTGMRRAKLMTRDEELEENDKFCKEQNLFADGIRHNLDLNEEQELVSLRSQIVHHQGLFGDAVHFLQRLELTEDTRKSADRLIKRLEQRKAMNERIIELERKAMPSS